MAVRLRALSLRALTRSSCSLAVRLRPLTTSPRSSARRPPRVCSAAPEGANNGTCRLAAGRSRSGSALLLLDQPGTFRGMCAQLLYSSDRAPLPPKCLRAYLQRPSPDGRRWPPRPRGPSPDGRRLPPRMRRLPDCLRRLPRFRLPLSRLPLSRLPLSRQHFREGGGLSPRIGREPRPKKASGPGPVCLGLLGMGS